MRGYTSFTQTHGDEAAARLAQARSPSLRGGCTGTAGVRAERGNCERLVEIAGSFVLGLAKSLLEDAAWVSARVRLPAATSPYWRDSAEFSFDARRHCLREWAIRIAPLCAERSNSTWIGSGRREDLPSTVAREPPAEAVFRALHDRVYAGQRIYGSSQSYG